MPNVNPETLAARAKKGKKTTGGNTTADILWLEAVSAEGELHDADLTQAPEGFLYQVNFQWTGHQDEVNYDFFWDIRAKGTYGNSKRCNGTSYIRDQTGMYVADCDWNRLTRPCLARPMKGSEVCQTHGGKIPRVLAAAQERLAAASDVVALRLITLSGPQDELRAPVAHKDRISAANSVLDRAGIKGGGLQVEITVPGYKRVLEQMFADDSEEEGTQDG